MGYSVCGKSMIFLGVILLPLFNGICFLTLGYHVVFLCEIRLTKFSWGWLWLQEIASDKPDRKPALDVQLLLPPWSLQWPGHCFSSAPESQPVPGPLWTHHPLLSLNGWRLNKSMAYCQTTIPLKFQHGPSCFCSR